MDTIVSWRELERLPWPWPLTGWYAEPLPADEASRLLRRRPGTSDPARHLREQLLAFWAEGPHRLHFAPMLATARDAEAALLRLVEGQLLMSVRLEGAMDRLDAGFRLAAPRLAPREYFRILRRHELLRRLPLGERPRPATGLEALLVEARLRRPIRNFPGHPGDTLG